MVQRAERLADFVTDRKPLADASVQALGEDHVGTYLLPFPCRWTGTEWLNATTMIPVDAAVVGWRTPPLDQRSMRRGRIVPSGP